MYDARFDSYNLIWVSTKIIWIVLFENWVCCWIENWVVRLCFCLHNVLKWLPFSHLYQDTKIGQLVIYIYICFLRKLVILIYMVLYICKYIIYLYWYYFILNTVFSYVYSFRKLYVIVNKMNLTFHYSMQFTTHYFILNDSWFNLQFDTYLSLLSISFSPSKGHCMVCFNDNWLHM